MSASDAQGNDDRYSRQERFAGIGSTGQRQLAAGRAAIIGIGALGSVSANILARAGVGFLRLIDRDYLELSNLQRQALYDEADLTAQLPKAEAAARKLRAINHAITVEAQVADLTPSTIADLCGDVQVIVDGTDNFEARFLINDFAVQHGIPWVYGGAIGSEGRVQTIRPGASACLRCVLPTLPPPGSLDTCETAGVLAPASGVVGSIQAAEALKILAGRPEACATGLLAFDLWTNEWRTIRLAGLRDRGDCPVCHHRQFDFLNAARQGQLTRLCGRNAVQVTPASAHRLDLAEVARRLPDTVQAQANPYLLRFRAGDYEFSVFADGRAIIKGTDDPAQARSLYARYLG